MSLHCLVKATFNIFFVIRLQRHFLNLSLVEYRIYWRQKSSLDRISVYLLSDLFTLVGLFVHINMSPED